MKTMTKKLLLTTGFAASIAAPIVTVISCGSDSNNSADQKKMDKTTQAMIITEMDKHFGAKGKEYILVLQNHSRQLLIHYQVLKSHFQHELLTQIMVLLQQILNYQKRI